jgi:hypothetical protein
MSAAAPPPAPLIIPAIETPPPVEVAKPVETRKPKAISSLTGTWEGEWEVDELGFTGRATLVIDRVDGRTVAGRSVMYDTPYGKLDEPFLAASFEAGRLSVKHRKNVTYTLVLNERAKQLSGPFVYTTNLGTFTGKITVARK